MSGLSCRRAATTVTLALLVCSTAWSFNARKSRFWQNLEAGKSQRLVFLGTSLSFSGTDGQAGNVGWPLDLKAELDRLFPGKVSVSNFANKGVYSNYVFSKTTDAIAANPDAIIIEYSSNDAVSRFGCRLETCSRAYGRGIVSKLQAALPNTDIFLYVTALPWDADLSCCTDLKLCGDDCGGEAWEKALCDGYATHLCKRGGRKFIETYFQAMRDVADEYDTYLIDTYWRFAKLNDQLGATKEGYGQYLPDGHHPGKKASTEIILPMMLDVFKGTGSSPAIDITDWLRGQEFLVGTGITVNWTYNADSVSGTASLQITTDNGISWKSIGLDNIALSQKKVSWAVPASIMGDKPVIDDVIIRLKADGKNSFDVTGPFSLRKEAMDDIIVDQNDANVEKKGYFSSAPLPTGYLGAAIMSPVVGKDNHVTFSATVQKAGTYGIYMWWPIASNACSGIPVTITHASGTASKMVNTKENGGKWNLLGMYQLQAGKAASVKMQTVGAVQEGTMYPDAVRFRGLSVGAVNTVLPSHAEALPVESAKKIALTAKTTRGVNSVKVPAGISRCAVYDVQGKLVWRAVDRSLLKAGSNLTVPHLAGESVVIFKFD